MFRKKIVFFFGIINSLLTKLARSRWLDIGLVLFMRVYVVMNLDSISDHKQATFYKHADKNLANIREETELRKVDRTVGVNSNIFSNISSGTV